MCVLCTSLRIAWAPLRRPIAWGCVWWCPKSTPSPARDSVENCVFDFQTNFQRDLPPPPPRAPSHAGACAPVCSARTCRDDVPQATWSREKLILNFLKEKGVLTHHKRLLCPSKCPPTDGTHGALCIALDDSSRNLLLAGRRGIGSPATPPPLLSTLTQRPPSAPCAALGVQRRWVPTNPSKKQHSNAKNKRTGGNGTRASAWVLACAAHCAPCTDCSCTRGYGCGGQVVGGVLRFTFVLWSVRSVMGGCHFITKSSNLSKQMIYWYEWIIYKTFNWNH